MTTNDQIRFTVYHLSETGSKVVDLDAIVDHASNLVQDANLLWILMSLKRRLLDYNYNFTIIKEGEDQ